MAPVPAGERKGALTKRHAGLVGRETLAAVALELDLDAALVRLGRSEDESGAARNPAIFADVLEAVIGGDLSRRRVRRGACVYPR